MHRRSEATMWKMLPILGALCAVIVLVPTTFAGEEEQPAAPAPPAPSAQAQGQEIPPVVAKVEDEEITGKEFRQGMMAAMRMKAARSAADPNRDPNQPPAGFERQDAERVLQSLIRSKVIYVLAKKAEVTVPDEEVNEAMAQAKARMPEGQFEQLLKIQDTTEEKLKELMREQLVSQKFMEQKTKDVTVTDEEVKEAYEELKESGRMEVPETANVAHILIKAERDGSEEDVAEAKKSIDAIRKRIVEGNEDFGEVAKEVTEDEGSKERGGTYENVQRGRMVPEFDKRLFELPIDEVSEPFQTQFGWHIMKVTDRKEAGTLEYEDVKDQVREAVEARAKGKAFNEFLESAVDGLNIEILLPQKEEPADEPAKPEDESKEGETDQDELPDEPA